ncbi:hypothetical protein ACNFCJ_08035 [Pseudomonas sp. NY15364]|uniref:hypothetical protein n=1 Tax=Pseudomonas sp. NY15364 TaxID=3400353 RepID=UPI003A86F997
MSHPITGLTPDSVPVESGGASASMQLQWIQKELNGHSSKLTTFEGALNSAADSIKCMAAESAERATKLAVMESHLSHMRDNIALLKSSQVTEAGIRGLHTDILKEQHSKHVELLDRLHAIQSDLAEQVAAAKETASVALQQHEERARSGRRWVVGLLVTVMLGIAGLTVSAVLTYMRLKGS